ncbi:MAG: hypothetical protein J4428_04220 [Candidatus Aenigmarchaeota archaeon]|nr:hypothetical protein [Candidatus Aenigmarchaeota archaeon]
MVTYIADDIKKIEPDYMPLIERGDIITGLSVTGYMPFSSFTGLPCYRMKAQDGRDITIVLGGSNRDLKIGNGPYSITVQRSVHSLIAGLVIEISKN